MDCSLPGFSIHGIFQARVLEWVAISFFKGSSQPRDQTWVSHIQADALPFEPPGKPGGTGKPLEDRVLAIPGHPKPEDLSEGFRDSRLHIAWQLEGHVHSGASDTVKQRL